ncbi:MAG: hypothetical protein ACE5KO_01295, partial [Candidatus Bathyarchaeia archaeon]
KEGSLISNNTGGSGGYGDPSKRDPHSLLNDVINGYMTIESAKKQYGMSVDSDAGKVASKPV